MLRSGDRLIQRVRGHEEELGRIRFEPSSMTYVLELKDTFGLIVPRGGFVRADEYHTMAEAKANAAFSPAVSIWHLIWMRSVVKREAEQVVDDRWDEIGAGAATGATKASVKDGLRAHLDRLPAAKIKKLFETIDRVAAFADRIRELMGW